MLVLVFVRREANLSELQADFVSKVSHELRTPLTAIRLFAETIERAKQDEATVSKCLTLLTTETERLTRRIERLLDWGRMEAGRKLYDLREENVADIIEEAVQAFPAARLEPGVELSTDVEPRLPTVFADRHAMVDAIVNLLTNAHKYGGSPRGDSTPGSARAQGGRRHHRHRQRSGHRAERARRIFDKFYRIDDRLSRRAEGSGTGARHRQARRPRAPRARSASIAPSARGPRSPSSCRRRAKVAKVGLTTEHAEDRAR